MKKMEVDRAHTRGLKTFFYLNTVQNRFTMHTCEFQKNGEYYLCECINVCVSCSFLHCIMNSSKILKELDTNVRNKATKET